MRALLPLAVAAIATAAPAWAAMPSCYEANKNAGLPAPKPTRSVTIVVDQTTVLDDALKSQLYRATADLLTPGTVFDVATFSAFSQGRYMDVVASGRIESPVPKASRPSIGVMTLRNLDACLKGQEAYAKRTAGAALVKATASASPGLARSEVIGGLKLIAQRVQAAPARDRVVLVASDMLENSSFSSFYAKRAVRAIDPAAEMAKTEKAGMVANFGNARVFVLGAGVLAPGAEAQTYRDATTMGALERFWTSWFARSNARLVEFGQPALLRPVR